MIAVNKLKKVEELKGRIKQLLGNAVILQLAKEGICPHYVLSNPITNEQTLLFVSTEVEDFLSNSYLNYQEGYFKANYTFLTLNDAECKTQRNDLIPDELLKITNLYKLPFEYMSTPPGIYFLCKGKTIQYIGQSVNIAYRISNHITEGIKDFDMVYFIKCPLPHLTALETALIRHLKPKLNKTGNGNLTSSDMTIIHDCFKTQSLTN